MLKKSLSRTAPPRPPRSTVAKGEGEGEGVSAPARRMKDSRTWAGNPPPCVAKASPRSNVRADGRVRNSATLVAGGAAVGDVCIVDVVYQVSYFGAVRAGSPGNKGRGDEAGR
jgi:hypothetical protein